MKSHHLYGSTLKGSSALHEIVVWYWRPAPHLKFQENLLSVKHIGDEDPTRSCYEVLGQVVRVGLAVAHLPAEGEVVTKDFMAHVHEDGVHTCTYKRGKITETPQNNAK